MHTNTHTIQYLYAFLIIFPCATVEANETHKIYININFYNVCKWHEHALN